jgi:Asp-tRNA(Asn)/Glu-tRNA(Gln) amidotransferase A subunit family amidase
MARTLNDLTYFTRSFIQMEPWKYDYTVHPLEWREEIEEEYRERKKLRVGVMRTDHVVDPSPACARALDEVAKALEAEGHEVFEALQLASQLLLSDGGNTFMGHFRTGEWNDLGAAQMVKYMRLPRFIKYIHYLYIKYVKGDSIWAGLLRDWHPKSAHEYWQLAGKREAFKARFFTWWSEEAKMDVMLTPPNATPAVPHGGMHDAVSSCGYTFMFNLVSLVFHVSPHSHTDKHAARLLSRNHPSNTRRPC